MNLFSKFLAHKKLTAFTFLLALSIGFLSPVVAHGLAPWCTQWNNQGMLNAAGSSVARGFVDLSLAVGKIFNSRNTVANAQEWIMSFCGPGTGTAAAQKAYESTAENTRLQDPPFDEGIGFKWLGGLIGDVLVDGPYMIASSAMSSLNFILINYLSAPITTDQSSNGGADFTKAWAQVRNLGNMLIVLGFVVVGIATALRLREYEAKKLLLPLILVALAINFSGLFCGLLIDAANLITSSFSGMGLQGAGQTAAATIPVIGGPAILLFRLQIATKTLLTNDLAASGIFNYVTLCAMFGVVYLGIAFTYFYLLFILLARYVILIMLYILSPLAFTFWVFPASRHLWTEWWGHFLKWVFIGVIGSFVLWLAATVMTTQSLLNQPIATLSSPSTTTPNAGQLITQVVIVLGFLVVGFKMTSQKTGIAKMASTAAIGLVSGGAMLAMGGLTGAAKLTGVAGAAQRGGQKVKDFATNAAEKFGMATGIRIVPQGTTASNQAARMKDPLAKLDAIQDNEVLGKIAAQKPLTAAKAAEKASAVQILAKRNALSAIDSTKREEAIAYAKSFGVSKELLGKASPTAGATPSKEEIMTHILKERIDKKVGEGISEKGAIKIAKHSMKGEGVTATDMENASRTIRHRRTIEGALGITAPVSDAEAKRSIMDKEEERLATSGMSKEAVAKQIVTFGNNIKSEDIIKRKEKLGEERIEKAIKKMPTDKVLELPKEAMPTFAKYAGTNQMTNLLRNGNDEKVAAFTNAFNDHLRELQHGDAVAQEKAVERFNAMKEATRRVRKNDDTRGEGGGGGNATPAPEGPRIIIPPGADFERNHPRR